MNYEHSPAQVKVMKVDNILRSEDRNNDEDPGCPNMITKNLSLWSSDLGETLHTYQPKVVDYDTDIGTAVTISVNLN